MNAAVLSNEEAIQVSPLSAHIGAEISGVDLTRPLNAQQVGAIRAALLKWRVIFFREQFLSHEQHVAFSAQFGELTVGHPVFGHVEGHPRDLFDLQVPQGDALRRTVAAASLDRLAYRCHRRGESAVRIDPARRDHPALWRRHAVDQPRDRV